MTSIIAQPDPRDNACVCLRQTPSPYSRSFSYVDEKIVERPLGLDATGDVP